MVRWDEVKERKGGQWKGLTFWRWLWLNSSRCLKQRGVANCARLGLCGCTDLLESGVRHVVILRGLFQVLCWILKDCDVSG
jgi:hypothetical protein